MRIAHVVASIADPAQGPSQSVPALCNELSAMGHDVELHVLDYGGETFRADARYQLHAYRAFPAKRQLVGYSRAMLSGLRMAARRADVLHWHGLWLLPNFYPYLAARNSSCALVASPRGMLTASALQRRTLAKRLVWHAGQGRALKATHCLHATSRAEAQTIRAVGLQQPIAIVENGIYLPQEPVTESEPTACRQLLYLGRLHPIKGLDRLLVAWRQIQDRFPGWQLNLVGPGEDAYIGQLRSQAEQIGARRVRFSPAVFGPERDATLRGADLYVLPSHSENFAMSVAEALAVGLPVVCSKGAPWQGLEKNGCGYWVSNSPSELAACLASALSLPREVLKSMGGRGRSWMRTEFSWAEKATQFTRVYEWLRGVGPKPRNVVDEHDAVEQ